MRKLVQITLATLVVGALSAPAAFAHTLTPSPTPTIGPLLGGSYLWTYNVTEEGNSSVETGDYFTIFDFYGFVPGSASVVAGWAFSSANLGPCPADLLTQVVCALADDPGLVNLTWTRTGGTIVGPVTIGDFSARSTSNLVNGDAWVSSDRDNQQGVSHEGAAGRTNVPSVPEPASMLLLGSGLVGLAALARRARA